MDLNAKQNQEIEKNIMSFFDKKINKKQFAKYLRHLNFIVMNTCISENCEDALKHPSMSTYTFYLNEFAEIIDPYINANED